MIIDNITQIILNIIFIYCFISIFYFTYLIYVEKNNFIIQLNFVVDEIFSDFKYTLQSYLQSKDPVTVLEIQIAMDKVLEKYEPSFIDDNQAFYDNLNSIKNSFIYISYGLILYVIAVAFFLYYLKGYNIFNMILTSFLNVFIILILEFTFINIVTANYISIDTIKIKNMLYKNIIDILDK